ncbi:MAG: glutamine synthetase [Desulfobacteraceae bacterium Eth-SRB1]|nr:MAG: glutamine synthetase [Desulfobacteraceae bacterium Eth-SRB1]
MGSIEEIKEKLKNVETTKILFTDLNGRVMSLPINPENIEELIKNGIGFDGSSIPGYATVENSDRLLLPDPESFRAVKFSDETLGFFVGHIYNEWGMRAKSDPRAVLEKVLNKAESEHGYRFKAGPEHEFFLLTGDEFGKKTHSDNAGYFQSTPYNKGELVRNRIINILKDCGIKFEKAHHEATPSQHEINLEPIDPLAGADRTVLFNYVTQKVAAEFGYYATFMPKPFDGYNRNAFHVHLSMQDQDGRNLFYDKEADHNLSLLAKHFIGGVLKYARETSIIMASNFNSYKAYVMDQEAPIVSGWGFRNRSSMLRVPYAKNPESTRIELRNPDPAGNVYLQFATFIAMGLKGIEEDLQCGQPDVKSTYDNYFHARVTDKRFLPRCLFEALLEAERSRFLKDLLGEGIYHNYMSLKTDDWEDHRTHVTQRELEKYLSI